MTTTAFTIYSSPWVDQQVSGQIIDTAKITQGDE
jgi:hypothetical protein